MMPDMPFVIRIWIVFLACLAAGFGVSLVTPQNADNQPVKLGDIGFGTNALFNVIAAIVILLLVLIYAAFW